MQVIEQQRLVSIEIVRSVCIIVFLIFSLIISSLPHFYLGELGANALGRYKFFIDIVSDLFNGTFVFLFAVGICWHIIKKILSGKSIYRQLIAMGGLVIFLEVVDLFYSGLLAPIRLLPFSQTVSGGAFPIFVKTGVFIFPTGEQFFQGGLMAMLGMSLFITMLFLSVLLWIQRKFSISAIIPLVAVSLLWLIFLGGLSGEGFRLSKNLFEQGGFYKVLSWFVYNWSGRPIALVGIVPFAFFGAILGLLIHETKTLRDYSYNIFFFFLLFSGFMIFLYGAAIVSHLVNSNQHGYPFYMRYRLILFSFIFILFEITALLIYYIDLKPAYELKEGKRTKWLNDDKKKRLDSFRRVGRIFFTLYLWQAFVLEFFSIVKERQLTYFFDFWIFGVDGGLLNLFFVFLVVTFWVLFFVFAHFLHFRGTLEYVIYLLFALRFKILKKESVHKTEDVLGWTDLYLFYLDF